MVSFLADSFFPQHLQANNHGSLQVISEYYHLHCPARGSTITFHPLEHLHPLEFHRPDEKVLHIGGSTIDLKSCSSSLELAEVPLVVVMIAKKLTFC